MQTIALTGASGFVGRSVVRALTSRGYSVRALVRSRDKARTTIPDPSVSLVIGDISDEGVADKLLQGAHACINLLGIIRETRAEPGKRPQTFQRLHIDATRILVAKCLALGVRRFVQMSAMNVSDVGVSQYQHTKFEAEQIVRRSDLDWTILRPSIVHGRDGEFMQMQKEFACGHAAPYFFMPYFTRQEEDKSVPLGPVHDIDPQVAPISVDDVARAFAECLKNNATIGEVYNLAGSETLSLPQLLKTIRDGLHDAHKEQQPWGVPSTIAAHVAMAAKAIGMGALLPFDEGMAKMGAQDMTATLDKFEKDLGFTPAPFTESFKQYAASM